MPRVSKIYLYDEPSVPEIKIEKQAENIEKTLGTKTEIRQNILQYAKTTMAESIASCRVFDPKRPFERHHPTEEEITFELENFSDSSRTENIIMYDGIELQNIFFDLIPQQENTLSDLHIVFTNKLTCTFDYNDYRYHGRVLIGSNPSIISTTGIIEAPAKPREYYMEMITNYRYGLNIDAIKEKFRGQYLEYHDSRLGKIVEGYLLQAIFYYVTGDAFCDSPECRLFNAHWQKDLLHSQIESGQICKRHQDILENRLN